MVHLVLLVLTDVLNAVLLLYVHHVRQGFIKMGIAAVSVQLRNTVQVELKPLRHVQVQLTGVVHVLGQVVLNVTKGFI